MANVLDSIFSVRIVKAGVEYVQRKTIELIGDGVTVADDPVNERTQITIVSGGGGSTLPHAATHLADGTDEIDADRLGIDLEPSNFVPQVAVDVTTTARHLSSFLNGIDAALDPHMAYRTEAGTAHTFVADDTFKTLLCTSNSAIGIVIPANASVAFRVGAVLRFVPRGTGQITVSGAGGVTIVAPGGKTKSATQNAAIYAEQLSADTWLLSGELTT